MPESTSKPNRDLASENALLRAQLAEAQEVIRAIQSGAVDAVVVSGPEGEQIFTLQGAEYAYRALVEAMNEGAATVSSDGVALYCNQRLADILGMAEEKILGASVARLFAAGSKEEFAALFANVLAGEAGKAELRLAGGDRDFTTVYVSLSRIEGQEPSAICMVVTDLREHKKRDELIAAGELARSILASAAEAIAVCDNDGIVINANEALRTLCGFNPLYQPFNTVLPLQISGQAEKFSVLTALASEGFRGREVTFRRNDGKPLTLLLSAARVSAPLGIAGCVLTLTEITERKRAEEALIRSEKLAALGRMAAAIAHEVNNPLAAAMNAVFLARGDATVSSQTRSALEIADQELRRAAHITSRTLGFYRDQNKRTPIELPKLIDEIIGVYARKLQERGITVHRRYRCCACPQACFLANAGELRQVISNLLLNGMDAVRDEGTLHLRLARLSSLSGGGAVIRLTIADTGSGIRGEHLSRLFEPFFTTKNTGTGLGMWISHEIIRKYGGAIRVRSREGRGTVCCVTLPAMATGSSSSECDSPVGAVSNCAALKWSKSIASGTVKVSKLGS